MLLLAVTQHSLTLSVWCFGQTPTFPALPLLPVDAPNKATCVVSGCLGERSVRRPCLPEDRPHACAFFPTPSRAHSLDLSPFAVHHSLFFWSLLIICGHSIWVLPLLHFFVGFYSVLHIMDNLKQPRSIVKLWTHFLTNPHSKWVLFNVCCCLLFCFFVFFWRRCSVQI